MEERLERMWQFIRGDLGISEYEKWLYADSTLERDMGESRYLALVGADYRDKSAVERAQRELETYARSVKPLACECLAVPDTAVLDMANPGNVLAHLEEVLARGEPFWWLHMLRCSACETYWLMAQEERQNDVFILHRLTPEEGARVVGGGAWPPDLDFYETLLRLGKAAGHAVRFVDPIGDSSLDWTMADLARQRPGIRVTELAGLLNLDIETANVIAERTIGSHGVSIVMDGLA